jgi:hypothetical protein
MSRICSRMQRGGRTIIRSQARRVATYVRGEAVYKAWGGRW